MTAEQLIEQHTRDELRELAKARNVSPWGTKAEIAQRIAEHLALGVEGEDEQPPTGGGRPELVLKVSNEEPLDGGAVLRRIEGAPGFVVAVVFDPSRPAHLAWSYHIAQEREQSPPWPMCNGEAPSFEEAIEGVATFVTGFARGAT